MLVEQTITQKLTAEFSPIFLNIENESHLHSAGRGAESHFKVTMVSAQFATFNTVARHRAVYACLANELANGVHALALHLYSPKEWQDRGEQIPDSTRCVGHTK